MFIKNCKITIAYSMISRKFRHGQKFRILAPILKRHLSLFAGTTNCKQIRKYRPPVELRIRLSKMSSSESDYEEQEYGNSYPPNWNTERGKTLLVHDVLWYPIFEKPLNRQVLKGLSKSKVEHDLSLFLKSKMTFLGKERLVVRKTKGAPPKVMLIVDTKESYEKFRYTVAVPVLAPIRPHIVAKYDLLPFEEGLLQYNMCSSVCSANMTNSITFARDLAEMYLVENSTKEDFKFYKEPIGTQKKANKRGGNYSLKCSVCAKIFSSNHNLYKHERNMHQSGFRNAVEKLERELADIDKEIAEIKSRIEHGLLSKISGRRKVAVKEARIVKVQAELEVKRRAKTKFDRRLKKIEAEVGIHENDEAGAEIETKMARGKKPKRKITNKKPADYNDKDFAFLYGLKPLKVMLERVDHIEVDVNDRELEAVAGFELEVEMTETNAVMEVANECNVGVEELLFNEAGNHDLRLAEVDSESDDSIEMDLEIDEQADEAQDLPTIEIVGTKEQVDSLVTKSLLAKPILPEAVKRKNEETKAIMDYVFDTVLEKVFASSIEFDMKWLHDNMPDDSSAWMARVAEGDPGKIVDMNNTFVHIEA